MVQKAKTAFDHSVLFPLRDPTENARGSNGLRIGKYVGVSLGYKRNLAVIRGADYFGNAGYSYRVFVKFICDNIAYLKLVGLYLFVFHQSPDRNRRLHRP